MIALELTLTTLILFIITFAASLIYYRRIKSAQKEYEGAKEIVDSIVSVFNKQLLKIERSFNSLESRVFRASISSEEAYKLSKEAIESVEREANKIQNISRRVEENEKIITSLKNEIQNISKRPSYAPPLKDIESPIPIQNNIILEQLTETEIEVLAIIEDKGEASVPEIKNRVNKTREHTARLLKKLYDKGFIDRNTNTMPYKYHIRKEIKDNIQTLKQNKFIEQA